MRRLPLFSLLLTLASASLLLLLSVACSAWSDETAVNASEKDGKRADKSKDCACCKDRNGYPLPPCHCLQQLWLDYPGPNDVYICVTHLDKCEEGEEDLWYGEPSNSYRPQSCPHNECEAAEVRGKSPRSLPGHGLSLTAANAWRMVERGLKSAKRKTPRLVWGKPQYHQIAQERVPDGFEVTDDIIVMAVPITVRVRNSLLDGETFHLCIHIDSLGGEELTPAEMEEDGEQGTGRQFRTKYAVNGEARRGLVWLK